MQYDIDIKSKYKVLFLEARELLLSYDDIQEVKKQRITTYSMNGKGICHMRTTHYGIDFGFLRGAKMEDDLDLLTGDGKSMRVLPVRSDLDEEVVKYYLDQAISLIEH